MSGGAGTNYVIISPVKDEENYIEKTIHAVLNQTIRPSRWIIVDDGSQDKTPSIVARYRQKFPWIVTLRLVRDANRQPGWGVIQAFAAGYESLRELDFDFIVKLDCDLDLPPNYFEQLIAKFHEDKRLGVASGVYLENRGGKWFPVKMPDYHAAGASKVVRVKCFADIGGFVPSRGWDTIDEIRAQMRGWKTRHFEDLQFRHLKNEGLGIGLLRTHWMLGEIYYLTGGGNLFLLLKVLHRMIFGKPAFLGGLLMLLGFLKPVVLRKQMLVSPPEARFYQQLLNRRIVSRLAAMFDWANAKGKAWRYT